MPKNIKEEFGRLFRQTREARRLSRAVLAKRLGISPKTIQSWEMGRTFIERLDTIPLLEAELGCSLSSFIARATGSAPPESPVRDDKPIQAAAEKPGSPSRVPIRLGPEAIHLAAPETGLAGDGGQEKPAAEWVAVPLLRPNALLNGDLSSIDSRDVAGRVAAPSEWAPKGGIMAAIRMSDSSLEPMIPLGATVLLNLSPPPPEKLLGKVAAIVFDGRGLRLRRVARDISRDFFFGTSLAEYARARLRIHLDQKDRIVGQAIGVMAALR